MADKPVTFIESGGRLLKVWIDALGEWDHFEEIVALLEADYAASVREAIDGPDARRWILELDGAVFELIHDDPWGTFMTAATPDGEAAIRRIGRDLERRLGPVP